MLVSIHRRPDSFVLARRWIPKLLDSRSGRQLGLGAVQRHYITQPESLRGSPERSQVGVSSEAEVKGHLSDRDRLGVRSGLKLFHTSSKYPTS